jgi:uncharacterized protein (TIGR02246 family)
MNETVEQVVATVEHAQQHEDVEEFLSLFHPDATWVTGHGRRLIGRDAIAEFTGQVLPGGMTDTTATYRAEHVVYVRPDVAVVSVIQRVVHAVDGVSEGRPTYILARGESGWQIVAAQNTVVYNG